MRLRDWLFSLLMLVATGCVQAGPFIINPYRFAGAGGPSYLVDEGFEGTGAPSGWTSSAGSPDYDYTSDPLVAVQSMALSGYTLAAKQLAYLAFTNSDDVYLYFQAKFPTIASTGTLLFLEFRTTTTVRAQVHIRPGPILRVQATGGTLQETVGTLSATTLYHFWVSYRPGTGTDAVLEIAFSTDGTKPTSGNNYQISNNGTATADANRIYFYGTYATAPSAFDVVIDHLLIANTPIGNNP